MRKLTPEESKIAIARQRIQNREWKKSHPERVRELALNWRNANLKQARESARNSFKRAREEFLNAYGHKCDCCGETQAEFLTLDHKNNDGARHRRESGRRLYSYLKKLGWPKDRFRLLCWNCNSARGAYGYCPHEINSTASHILLGMAC